MTLRFFAQVDDELRGLLGPALRGYHSQRTGRLLKLWYGHPAVHFEAQRLPARWSPTRAPALEVGLHLEARSREANDAALRRLAGERGWRRALREAEAGPALGPQAGTWRRVSEVMEAGEDDDPDLASEVAERLARYVRTLSPGLRRIEAEGTFAAPSPSSDGPPLPRRRTGTP